MREITNDSGTFWVDEEGALRKFQCEEENDYFPLSNRSYRNEKHLNWLEIPEGVTVLRENAFREYTVLTALNLPESLRLLGTGDGCAFAECCLPDMSRGSGNEQILKTVERYVTEEMKENDPAHDQGHVLRVVKLTRRLCQSYPEATPFRAELLAWLHDMHDDKLKSHQEAASLY